MDKELNSLLESILLLLIQMLKGFIMGVWHGLRKALQNKWYLTGIGITLVFSVICITEKAMVCRMIPETIPEWLQQGIYLMLLAAPVIYLFLIGQTGQKNYDKCFEDIGFKGKNGKFPKYAGSSKEGKKILLFFQSTIPLSEWRSSRERLETALDCSIIKIENGRNKRTVKLTTLPSDYKIPTMVKWSEEYLNDKNGVLTLGISALDTISFNLNRVPHVLVAGETGSGKSVILRCLLWQMIEQGARVYMIDFKGGVEFGKQYEQYGEVITERERALQVLDLLVKENEYIPMTPDVNVVISHSEYTVLVVDDVVSNVLLLKVLLTNEKFKVITAGNGKEALSQAVNARPDLILLDVMMPEMNGFEVAERLKADPETQHIPIIFLTALNTTADIVKGFKVGANDFISKPFNKEELVIRVTHQISLIAAKRIIMKQTEELRKIIMGRDKLYSVIAHDLRSPMGSIKMVLNMLILSLPSEQIGKEMFDMLSMANQSTEDVFSLLDNLLKWTKSQIGKLNVVYQDFDIVGNIASVIEIFNLVAGMKNIKVNFPVHGKIEVHADMDMMKTILRNLLSNAIKFSYNDSEILVNAEIEGDKVIVSVKDTGKGMSEEDQKKLLNTETHFSKYGTNNEEGSGLGLLLCQDFAVKNGGHLWFESEEGKGSTFFFSVALKK